MRLPIRSGVLRSVGRVRDATGTQWHRWLALLAGLVLVASFLRVLYYITDVAGGTGWLFVTAASALLAGTIAARRLPLRPALLVGGTLFALGLTTYVHAIPDPYLAVLSWSYLESLIRLGLGSLSLVEIRRADLWAISIAPAPVFATWYLVLRRHYDLGAWVGGLTLGFFILTGDATQPVSLIGVTSALGVLGFGHLEQAGGTWRHVREVGILLAVAIVVTRLARPATARLLPPKDGSASVDDGGSSATTLEGSLLEASEQLPIRGSISLAPTARFTVSADQPAYWRVAAYDRFTGERWVRTGNTTAYDGPLPSPPGETKSIEQTFTVESAVDTMPAAWKPVRVDAESAGRTRVTDLDGLQPSESFTAGASYSVTSEQPTWSDGALQNATGSVRDSIRDRYLQLPASTPDRVRRAATDIAGDHDTPAAQAAAIQQWLAETKSYSLDVTRPRGHIADAFIFEMSAGYCVYFATAMVVMLRTLEIPARFVVGYTTGQQVDDHEWVVRGLNSHAWVEVYFPDIGWVPFDPTPAEPRQEARNQRLRSAREDGTPGVDTDQSRPTTTTAQTPGEDDTPSGSSPTSQPPTTTATETPTASGLAPERGLGGRPTQQPGGGVPGQTSPDASVASRRSLFTGLSESDQLAVGAGVVGILLGVTRLETLKRGLRALSWSWHPTISTPRRDIEQSFDRLETVLARQYRPREEGETRREYVQAIQQTPHGDDRLPRLLQLYEHAVYRDGATRAHADEAREIATQLVRERSSLPSW